MNPPCPHGYNDLTKLMPHVLRWCTATGCDKNATWQCDACKAWLCADHAPKEGPDAS